ncbi:ABC transporter permease [Tsukamurella pulmonis]|uniref:ABC transporter permease n=1 Tax=Tsukamurella pulmonis TaxID=47312 RepID=UPI001EDE32BC|nr:ABC transporter permease [Tsukamurella pulmonis]
MAAVVTAPEADLRRVVASMQWTLYKRRSTGGRLAVTIVLGILGTLAALGLVLGAVAAGLERSSSAAAYIAATLVGIGVLWAYLPALSGFSDNTLQPRQFTLLPLQRELARALFLASLIGVPVPLTALAFLSVIGYAAARAPLTLVLAAPAALLTVVLVVALSRVISLTLSQAVRTRRGREAALLLFVAGFCVLYAGQFLLNKLLATAGDDGPRIALAIPFAWGIAAVERAVDGQWGIALGAVAGLAALDAALLAAWQSLVRRLFAGAVPVPTSSRSGRERRGRLRGGWRAGPRGAVVARELSLWGGDVRRRYQLMAPIAFGIMSGVLPLFVDDFPFDARWGAWMVLLMAVMSGLNLYGLDGRSFWHIAMIPRAAGADVRGRQLAWALVIAPIAVLPVIIVRAFGDDPLDRLAVPAAVTVCAIGVGAGLVVLASAAAPYPVPEARKMMSVATRNSSSGAAIGWAFASAGILVVTVGPCALLGALLPGAASWIAVPVAAAVGGAGWWLLGRSAVQRLQRSPDQIHYAVTRA